ncbi:MAG: glycosyltransferase 87 family protein [Planctomycetaceae bacterium]
MDGLQSKRRRFRRLTAALIVALVLFGWFDVRRRARIEADNPESHRTDITIFTGAGAAFLADDAPYEYANPRGWRYAYPPLCALLLAPLAWLSTQTQAVVWYAISCGLMWWTWRDAVRISRQFCLDIRLAPQYESAGRWLGGIALATAALPVLNCLQRGQVGVLNLWLLVWGLRLLIEAKSWPGALVSGFVLAMPAVVKVTPSLPALAAVGVWGLARAREGRWTEGAAAPVGLALGGLAGLFLVPALVLGWSANWRHLGTWTDSILSMAVEVDPSSTLETPYTLRNQSLTNAVYRAGNTFDYWLFGGPDDRAIDAIPFNPGHQLRMDAPLVGTLLTVVRLLLLGLLGQVGWRAVQSGDRFALARVFALACVASLIVSPLSRGYYFVLWLPAVLWGNNVQFDGPRSRLEQVLLWMPLVATSLHYLWLPVAGRLGVLGLATTAWYVLAAWHALRRERVLKLAVEGPVVSVNSSQRRVA